MILRVCIRVSFQLIASSHARLRLRRPAERAIQQAPGLNTANPINSVDYYHANNDPIKLQYHPSICHSQNLQPSIRHRIFTHSCRTATTPTPSLHVYPPLFAHTMPTPRWQRILSSRGLQKTNQSINQSMPCQSSLFHPPQVPARLPSAGPNSALATLGTLQFCQKVEKRRRKI